MKQISIIIVACFALLACNEKPKEKTKLQRISWINGSWTTTNAEGTTTESWKPLNDSTLQGVGNSTDTAGNVVNSEQIQIVLRGNELWYIPTVKDQNMGQPVSFREVVFSDTMVVFENLQHDFPKRIVYIWQPGDNMLAYIEGDIQGTKQRIDFPYKRQ